MIFFVNLPIGLLGMYLVFRHMPDYRSERSDPIDFVGLSLFGSGIALLSYVLEIFGEHNLNLKSVVFLLGLSVLLLLAYGRHALGAEFPLLKLKLFRVRTFRVAVVGSFATRLGVGGMPFLLPLLYQIGLGYTPVQSGLLIAPQPLAAMSLKMLMPRIPAGPAQQHGRHRRHHDPLHDRGTRQPCVADCRPRVHPRVCLVDAVHLHEHARFRGSFGRRREPR